MKTFEEFVKDASGRLQEEIVTDHGAELDIYAGVDGTYCCTTIRRFKPLGINSIKDYTYDNFNLFEICNYVEKHTEECQYIWKKLYKDWVKNYKRIC